MGLLECAYAQTPGLRVGITKDMDVHWSSDSDHGDRRTRSLLVDGPEKHWYEWDEP